MSYIRRGLGMIRADPGLFLITFACVYGVTHLILANHRYRVKNRELYQLLLREEAKVTTLRRAAVAAAAAGANEKQLS